MVILINDETTASHELDEQLAKFLGVTVAPFSHMTDAALSAVPEGWTPTFDGKAWTLSYTSVNGEGNTTTYAFGGYPATSSALSLCRAIVATTLGAKARNYAVKAANVARDYAPEMHPCEDCGNPVIGGYQCTHCEK